MIQNCHICLETSQELFNSYADKQELGVEEVQALFNTYIEHHPCLASQMLEVKADLPLGRAEY